MCSGDCRPDGHLVTDEICGDFNTTTAPPPLSIYTKNLTVSFVSGTVSVYYDRGTPTTLMAKVTYNAGETALLTVPIGNTVSQTFDDISTVSIDTAAAIGKYCLIIE